MTIITVEKDQLTIVRQLALEIWPDTFKDILSPEQIDYMLNMMYSQSSLAEQLENNVHFVLVEENGTYLGFSGFEFHYKNESKTKIHKIYIHQKSQGKGVGRFLIDHIATESLKRNINTLTLNVNRYNKAVGFYEKTGFKTTYTEDIDIGNGFLMEDYVMEKKI